MNHIKSLISSWSTEKFFCVFWDCCCYCCCIFKFLRPCHVSLLLRYNVEKFRYFSTKSENVSRNVRDKIKDMATSEKPKGGRRGQRLNITVLSYSSQHSTTSQRRYLILPTTSMEMKWNLSKKYQNSGILHRSPTLFLSGGVFIFQSLLVSARVCRREMKNIQIVHQINDYIPLRLFIFPSTELTY